MGAFAGVATSRLSEYIDTIVPGFKQELSAARRSNGNSNVYDPDSATWGKTSSIDQG